jgi:NAD(P)-dependent dehydrogenase (short-subunit alcohol dehydrogenase family)
MTAMAEVSMFSMKGRVALVTGSTKGIGKAIARALGHQGARVTVSSRKAEACETVAASFAAEGIDALAQPCNINDEGQLRALVDATMARWGRIDCVVCNAALNPYYGPFLDIPDDAYDKTMGANIRMNMKLVRMVVPQMIERRDGSIIVVSSIAGLKGSDKLGTYALSKAADMQLVKNLAVAYGRHNVRANAIAPGLVRTDFARVLWEDPQRAAATVATYPIGRLGEPEDIAGMAVLLASPAGAWITGQTIVVDGGWSVYGE